jgi:hypothetical protein
MIKCLKCNKGRMFVDRVFLSHNHLELYCLACGKREMYQNPERHGKRSAWIMNSEKIRAKRLGSTI